jgi:hypothetical protein
VPKLTSEWNEIKDLGARERTAIEWLQPYNGRHDDLRWIRITLAMLHNWHIMDKHRRLHFITQAAESVVGSTPSFPPECGFVQEWTLTHADRIVSANRFRNLHHYQKAAVSGAWREAFGWLAKEAGMPPLQQVGVRVQVSLHGRRQMDVDAATACAKAAIDGLVDAGILSDDKPPFVQWITFCAPVLECERDLLTLSIVEVPA